MIKIITLSRLTREKGIQRCIDLAKLFPFEYVWDIYGIGGTYNVQGTNVNFKGFDVNAKDYIQNYDYLAQLSETEGFCYSIQEALQRKVPVLITPFPSGKELVIDKKNGYIIPFDLKNINFDKIKNEIPILNEYKEKSNEQDWISFFKKVYQKPNVMKIKIIKPVSNFKLNEIVDVSVERAKSAIERGLAIEVEEKKETKTKKTKV